MKESLPTDQRVSNIVDHALVQEAVEKYAGFLEENWEDKSVLNCATLLRTLCVQHKLMGTEIERLDADAACERAEKESLKLEVERLRSGLTQARDWLCGWGSAEPYLQQIDALLAPPTPESEVAPHE